MFAALIVLEDRSNHDHLRALLASSGFEVHEVRPDPNIRDRIREIQPDVILLDQSTLCGGDQALCRSIRAWEDSIRPPILMLLDREEPSAIQAALEAGADECIGKDSLEALFRSRIRRLAREHRLDQLATLNEGLAQIGRLLAGIVHEIRGPVAVIRGNAELLRMDYSNLPEVEARLEPLIQNCQLLQVRLEHLMAAVRGNSGDFEPLDISLLVQEVTNLFRTSARVEKPRISIVTDCPDGLPAIRGDVGRLLQVFLNLLGNAFDAIASTRSEGQIHVSASTERVDARDWLRVDVSDDGPGLPEAELGRIFDPLFTTKPSGSGIGLYLADTFVRKHGGRITAENLPGRGARLSVWLPVEPPPEAPAERPSDPGVVHA